MRILALLPNGFGGFGGIARFNRDLLTALSSSPTVTSVTALPRIAGNKSEKLPPKIFWRQTHPGKFRYVVSVLMALMTEGPFDLIFCGHINLAPLAALLSRSKRLPLWLQVYGDEIWMNPRTHWRWAANQAVLITAISRYTRRKFLNWSRVEPEKVKILPCTVRQEFRPGPKPDYLLKRYELTEKRVLLTVSRLSIRDQCKGHDRVIRLMPRLLQKYPNLVYVIVGDGLGRPLLENLASELKLNGSIRFVGQVSDPELADHYRLADLFVMPSNGEGFGIVFLEAPACGIPVIGGNQDGSIDALREGRVGAVIDPDNSDELIRAIEEALNSKQARRHEIACFSPENFTRHVQSLAGEAIHHA